MQLPVDARIEAQHLITTGLPMGVPFDREDAPNLSRELDGLCDGLKCSRPAEIVFAAEFAVRLQRDERGFWRAKRSTLVIGWPLLQLLDADELRVALALALSEEIVTPGAFAGGAADQRIAQWLGRGLLQRTLSRLLAAQAVLDSAGLQDWSARARCEGKPPVAALAQLRACIEARGRGNWHAELQRALGIVEVAARLAPLGGADLTGGSHRNAAQAMLWEGLCTRIWTALEAPFLTLLTPHWQACYDASAPCRERAKVLTAQRRAAQLDLAGLIELAELIEFLAGPRAAHPLFQQAYAQQRQPSLALALARTMIAVDAARATVALSRLAASSYPVAEQARALLDSLPTRAVSPSLTPEFAHKGAITS